MKNVLVTMRIGKGGGERISATTWMGHKVGRGGDDSGPFRDQVVGEEVMKEIFGDHVNWKGVMRTFWRPHGYEEFFFI
jgi:hypothetical protein